MNERADNHKRKRKGMLKSHPTSAITTARTEFPREATALPSRQSLTQETVSLVKFSQPACELAQTTPSTAKQVFLRTRVFHLSESEVRKASTSKTLSYVRVLKLKSYFFLCTNIYSEYVNPSLFMLKKLLQCIFLNYSPEKSYICMQQSIIPSLSLVQGTLTFCPIGNTYELNQVSKDAIFFSFMAKNSQQTAPVSSLPSFSTVKGKRSRSNRFYLLETELGHRNGDTPPPQRKSFDRDIDFYDKYWCEKK